MNNRSKPGGWECSFCHLVLRTRRERDAHYKVCENKLAFGHAYNYSVIDEACPFCGRHFKKKFSLTNHVSLCDKNPDRDLEKLERICKAQQDYWSSDRSKRHRLIISKASVFNNFWEYRSKNPIIYESPSAGRVRLDSSWERLVAERLDFIGVEWYRPRFMLPYFDCNGNEHNFIPDFYVKQYRCFIEVKSPFISKWQNSNNKVEYIKEHYKFVKWIESEGECRTFSLEDLGFDFIPDKIEDALYSKIAMRQEDKIDSSLKRSVSLESARWDIIINSNIDFSKFGWVEKLSALFNISPNKAGVYVKQHFPDFYNERCFKRRTS